MFLVCNPYRGNWHFLHEVLLQKTLTKVLAETMTVWLKCTCNCRGEEAISKEWRTVIVISNLRLVERNRMPVNWFFFFLSFFSLIMHTRKKYRKLSILRSMDEFLCIAAEAWKLSSFYGWIYKRLCMYLKIVRILGVAEQYI
jgi:hypothetical protein